MIQADFSYRIDPDKAYQTIMNVHDYVENVKESVKAAISTILQQQDFAAIKSNVLLSPQSKIPFPSATPASHPPERKLAVNINRQDSGPDLLNLDSTQQEQPSFSDQIKDFLKKRCEGWGITLSQMRLLSVEAKDPELRKRIAMAGSDRLAAQSRAFSIETEAKAQANARVILADGDSKAINLMANAKARAIKRLRKSCKQGVK